MRVSEISKEVRESGFRQIGKSLDQVVYRNLNALIREGRVGVDRRRNLKNKRKFQYYLTPENPTYTNPKRVLNPTSISKKIIKRKRHPNALPRLIERILENSEKPSLSLEEILKAVLDAGYKTKTDSPLEALYKRLHSLEKEGFIQRSDEGPIGEYKIPKYSLRKKNPDQPQEQKEKTSLEDRGIPSPLSLHPYLEMRKLYGLPYRVQTILETTEKEYLTLEEIHQKVKESDYITNSGDLELRISQTLNTLDKRGKVRIDKSENLKNTKKFKFYPVKRVTPDSPSQSPSPSSNPNLTNFTPKPISLSETLPLQKPLPSLESIAPLTQPNPPSPSTPILEEPKPVITELDHQFYPSPFSRSETPVLTYLSNPKNWRKCRQTKFPQRFSDPQRYSPIWCDCNPYYALPEIPYPYNPDKKLSLILATKLEKVNQPLCIQAAIWRFYPDEATRHSALNRVLETLKTMPDLVPSNYPLNSKTLPDIYAFNNANRRLHKDIISLLEKAKV